MRVIKMKQNLKILSIKSLKHHVSNVIFKHRIKFDTVSGAFCSKFYKLSPSNQRLSNLNYIKLTHKLRIC